MTGAYRVDFGMEGSEAMHRSQLISSSRLCRFDALLPLCDVSGYV